MSMFSKKHDDPPESNPLSGASPDTVAFFERSRRIEQERNELETTCSRLKTDLAEAHRQIDFQAEQLRIAERKRDMFQRHAVALYTRMVDLIPDIRILADKAEAFLQEARTEASSGNAEEQSRTIMPEAINLDDGLAQVVAGLKGEGK